MNIKNNHNKELKEKLVRKLCDEALSDKDLVLIKQIAKEDKQFEHQVNQLKKVHDIYKDIQLVESIDMDFEYRKIESKIKRTQKRLFLLSIQRYAAILAIPLLISVCILSYIQFIKTPDFDTPMVELYVPHGAIMNYELPDKSMVCLNSGSRLRYPQKFDKKRREVTLDGEGFFTVSANKEHPFLVNTHYGISSYVYGTQFNITAYKEDKHISTTLFEGKLDLRDSNTGDEITLIPGDVVSYNQTTKSFNKRQTDLEANQAWQSGMLVFRDTPLPELLNRLERRFNIKFNVHGTISETTTIRATFETESLEQILDYLALSIDIKWESQAISYTKGKTAKEINIVINE